MAVCSGILRDAASWAGDSRPDNLVSDRSGWQSMMPEDPNKRTLHPSRLYTLIYVCLGLGMDVLGAFLLFVGARDMGILAAVTGFLCLLFFGLITVLFAVQFIWPAPFGLTLDTQGFTVRMNFGRRRYRWKEVENFFLFQTFALQPVVAFKYHAKPEIHGLQWTRGLWGRFDGTLPQNLPVRGRALLGLMENWRLRATENA